MTSIAKFASGMKRGEWSFLLSSVAKVSTWWSNPQDHWQEHRKTSPIGLLPTNQRWLSIAGFFHHRKLANFLYMLKIAGIALKASSYQSCQEYAMKANNGDHENFKWYRPNCPGSIGHGHRANVSSSSSSEECFFLLLIPVKHHQIGRSVCQSGRFFLSSLLPISQVSFRVSINLHFFPLTSFAFGFALVPFLTNVSHIDDRLISVSSCAEKSLKVQLMNSWCKARSDLFKSAGLDLRCQAS